jgi:hypothetical protein
MAAPYKRIVILHVAIIAGGFAVAWPRTAAAAATGARCPETALDMHLHPGARRRSERDSEHHGTDALMLDTILTVNTCAR